MADYKINTPDGSIEATGFNELLIRVSAEVEFWSQFDFSKLRSVAFGGSRVDLGLSYVAGYSSSWPQIYAKIVEIGSESLEAEFAKVATIVDELHIPPLSTSMRSRIFHALWNDGRETEAALLLSTFAMRKFSNRDLKGGDADIGASVGYGYALNTMIDYGINQPPSDYVLEIENLRKLSEQAGLEVDRIVEKRNLAERELSELKDSSFDFFKRVKGISVSKIWKESRKIRASEKTRQDRFQEIEDAFKVHLSVKRPVELWTTREGEHKEASEAAWEKFLWTACAFTLLILLVALFGGGHIASSFVHPLCVSGAEAICDRIYAKGPLLIAALLGVTTVALWFLRLQMKIHLSERHLKLDARERRAFAETYLALLEGGSVSRDQEALVLGSLFRPTEDGIIRDEGALDPSISGILAKALERGR